MSRNTQRAKEEEEQKQKNMKNTTKITKIEFSILHSLMNKISDFLFTQKIILEFEYLWHKNCVMEFVFGIFCLFIFDTLGIFLR